MIQPIIYLAAFLLIIAASCTEKQETVYTKTFNTNDLPESKEADQAFIAKYSQYINTTELFDLDPRSKAISEFSSRSSKANGLQKSIEFEFDFKNTPEMYYYTLNTLTEYKDSDDVGLGWDISESAFWAGIMSKSMKKEEFSEYKNSKFHSLGDYSEYSEAPIGEKSLFIFHIKWNNLIIYYSQTLPSTMKDEFVKMVEHNFKEIKTKS